VHSARGGEGQKTEKKETLTLTLVLAGVVCCLLWSWSCVRAAVKVVQVTGVQVQGAFSIDRCKGI
jgi:hypothetical protein